MHTLLSYQRFQVCIQLLIVNKAAVDKFFIVRHLHDTKLLLKRRGHTVGLNCTNAHKLYEGVSIIMKTTRLLFNALDYIEDKENVLSNG
jgi:hypothetical protein